MSDRSHDTAEFDVQEQFSERLFAPSSTPLQIEFGAATHIGKVRRSNDDHYAVVRRSRSSELLLASLSPDDLALAEDHAHAMIVADGMGGPRFGEIASRVALQTMFELANQATSWVMKITGKQSQDMRQRVEAYVERIENTLREYTLADPALAGMGTTWTSAHLLPPHAMVVHVGDSRAYSFKDGQLRQITRDDTMAQAFIDTGMDPESVKRFGHILLNSFGGDDENASAQIYQLAFGPGDQLLLCSDGLTDMVEDQDIAGELQLPRTPQKICDALIARALANGGKDNVTVVLAQAAAQEG